MRKHIKILVALVIISLAAISCKAPCGCNGGRGFGEVKSADQQVEQRA